ncbi:helix-turn-helix domain-containing protein [Desulfurivibrio dismutans]|uniref:helix-turn-helix domain-containing protein n=1 Tax=Desulfurivibrio dismutans TaxID=1398908 RepID=UPI0023DA346A|nr:helix-turn-helix domain-containing protein [Desulfurivibrio alkaliphilus]MDF1613604.1 helix-turn-helix domain-containing protein [Desulfurivibrio alkaliphilus]
MSSEQTRRHTAKEPSPAPDEGLPLGEKLRRARTEKGVSLEEAAEATRIHTSTLRALEENDQTALPASTFTRGFVRIYANYLGLDQETALRQHIKELGLPDAATTEKININEILAGESMAEPLRAFTGSRLALVLVALVLVLAVYWGYTSYLRPMAPPASFPPDNVFQQTQPEAPPPAATATAPEPLPAPPAPKAFPELQAEFTPDPAATDDQPAPEAASAPSLDSLEALNNEASHILEARFTEDTWVRIQIDHGPSRQLFFQPGDNRTWRAAEQVELRIGNAGGVELSYNGEPLPPLGRSGQVTDLSFP